MKRFFLTMLIVVSLLAVFISNGSATDDEPAWYSYAEAIFSYFETRPLVEGEQLRYGVDVSQHQGDIDWQAVADSGITFAYIRIGFRSYADGTLHEDTKWEENVQGALAVGIQTGVYIYSQAISAEEAVEEAQFILDRIDRYGITLPLVQDFEYAGGYFGVQGRLYEANLDNYTRTVICYAFSQTVEEAGYQAMTYATLSMLQDELYSDYLSNVWLSHYTTATTYQKDYSFWQCTEDGIIPGIEGTVDLNVWYDNGTTPMFYPLQFTDVSIADDAYESIRKCVNQGIISGVTEYTYEPNTEITRAQLLTMLYRLQGMPAVDTAGYDSYCEAYSTEAFAWAISNRIFMAPIQQANPEQSVAKQEVVAMLYRMAGSPDVNGNLDDFEDANNVRSYYKNAMLWAVETGIIRGNNHNHLKPTEKVDRATAAILIQRYIACIQ